MTTGLFGGSFDPPHTGHLRAADTAWRGFGLDSVIWLPTPHSPFKAGHAPASYTDRLAMISDMISGIPYMSVSNAESKLGPPHRSWRILEYLQTHNPLRKKFIWICGADSFKDMHLWERARYLEGHVCFGVLGRPGSRFLGSPCPVRIPRVKSRELAFVRPPAWAYLPLHEEVSSTAIRNGLN